MNFKILRYVFLLLIVITACDDVSDTVVDSATEPFNITAINVPEKITYYESAERLNVKVTLDNSESIDAMWFKVRYHDGSFTIAPKVEMLDNGDIENNNDLQANDNTFSGYTELTDENPRGTYTIEIYLETIDGVQKKPAVLSFTYETFVENIAPVLSELSAPDTVIVQDPRSVFIMSVRASDENGQQDIGSVFFVTTRPDGSSSGARLYLHDSGNQDEDGDAVEGDGIYSIIVEVTNNNAKGEYRFDFQAQDRSNEKSQILSHNIVLK